MSRIALRLPRPQVYRGQSERRECWVASLSIDNRGSVIRSFLRPMTDHGNNSALVFFLAPGHVYDVCESESGKKRYYCMVVDGKVKRLSFDSALEWIQAAA